MGYAEDIVDDDEFILFYDFYGSKNPDFPYASYPPFDLQDMEDSECLAEFRVHKRDIPVLADALQIPPTFRCRQRSVCEGIEGLCMLLRRISYPCRYGDMVQRFARPVPVLSMITNTVLDYIYDLHGHRITHWNNAVMSTPQLQVYADAISECGAPLENCFGFIDGTVRPICRPGQNQRVVYNGHKRVHALKFQSVALPNGIIGNIYGPVGKKVNFAFLTQIFYFLSPFQKKEVSEQRKVNNPPIGTYFYQTPTKQWPILGGQCYQRSSKFRQQLFSFYLTPH